MKLILGLLKNLRKLDWILLKSILELEKEDLIKRTDLEEETVIEVIRILKQNLKNKGRDFLTFEKEIN